MGVQGAGFTSREGEEVLLLRAYLTTGVPSGNGSGQVILPSLVERGRDRIAAQRHLTGDRDGGDPARDSSTATSLTPPRFVSSSATARTQ